MHLEARFFGAQPHIHVPSVPASILIDFDGTMSATEPNSAILQAAVGATCGTGTDSTINQLLLAKCESQTWPAKDT